MRHTHAVTKLERPTRLGSCPMCGIPLDSEYFDESGVVEAPAIGEQVILARFELPPQYCGVLEYFSQFTDEHAGDPAKIATPGLLWTILVNNRPLYPNLNYDRIVNPWGYGSFQISIRLDDSATIAFVVRRVSNTAPNITQVGGRIVGRYWYNAAYGDVV
jgi:hypothetical protein